MNSNNNNNNFDAYNSFVSYGNDEIQREQSHDWVDYQLSLSYAQAEEDEVQQEAARVEDELNDAFFALHPQPTLQEAQRIAWDLRLEGIALDQAMELEDEDSDESDDDDAGMLNNCNDVCACIRYFEPMEVDEVQDSALYERKCALQQAGKFPNKRQKIFDENEVIPMDISDDEEDEAEDHNDNESDHDVYESEDDEGEVYYEEDICLHDINRAHQVCYDCIWYLNQQARDARLGRFDNDEDEDEVQPVEEVVTQAVEQDPYHDFVFPVFGIDSQFSSPMEVEEVEEEEEVEPRPPIRYQRQTTCWVDEETGETVYNGSSTGSRTSEDDNDSDSDDNYYEMPDLINISQVRYQQNLYELEVTYDDGENVNNAQDAERVYQLRRDIEKYERRYKYEYERNEYERRN